MTPALGDQETQAFREAAVAFLKVYVAQVQKLGRHVLAGTTHLHRSMVLDPETRTGVLMSLKIEFSEVISAEQLEELIEQAQRAPGTVAES